METTEKAHESSWNCWLTADTSNSWGIGVNLGRTVTAVGDLFQFQAPIWRDNKYWEKFQASESKEDENIHSILVDSGVKKPLFDWRQVFTWNCSESDEMVRALNRSTIDSCHFDQIYFDRYARTKPIFSADGSLASFSGMLCEEDFPEGLNESEFVKVHKSGYRTIYSEKIPEFLKASGKKRAIIGLHQKTVPERYKPYFNFYSLTDNEYARLLSDGDMPDGLRHFIMRGP